MRRNLFTFFISFQKKYVSKNFQMSYLSWSVSQVIQRLSDLDLDQYADNFKDNDISGAVLPLLADRHLKELGISCIGHRLKFLKYVQSLTKGGGAVKSARSQGQPQPKPQRAPPKQREPEPEPEEDYVPPSSSGTSSNNAASSAWEQKRRQMKLKKMQAEKQKMQLDDDSSNNRSNNRLIDQDVIEEAPKPAKRPLPQRSAPAKPKPQPRYTEEDDDGDDDDDGYTPPPPPKRPARKQAAPPPPADDDGDDDRVQCAYCRRKFASDRIEKHEVICARMSSKKKRVFDASKQRLQGTEAAQYANKAKNAPEPKKKPSKFKQEHEKLVEALRAARKVQAYEKAKEEGRAVGPPPELPKYEIEDDDRVQCPYCGRKFGQEAAQKHIAVCERMNAGKRGPVKRGGRR